MNKEYRYILASGSPRRREILSRLGLKFSVQVSEADESHADLPPEEIVMELAKRKAQAVAAEVGSFPEPTVIIAADTLVALDGKVLGKPADREESERMIRSLSGRAHQVYTGVRLLVCPQGPGRSFYERTDVHVRPLSDEEILTYVQSGEGDDKAGAYAIQGEFGRYITSFEGDYDNVVGFPAERFLKELELLKAEKGEKI